MLSRMMAAALVSSLPLSSPDSRDQAGSAARAEATALFTSSSAVLTTSHRRSPVLGLMLENLPSLVSSGDTLRPSNQLWGPVIQASVFNILVLTKLVDKKLCFEPVIS